MLIDRIIGAFTFRKGVYAEVEGDASFTTNAWLIVAVAAFLSSLGAAAVSGGSFASMFLGALVGTIFSVIGFGISAFVISWVGVNVFKAQTNFEEVVRTTGLAFVWTAVGVLGILGALASVLACITGPIQFAAWIAGLVAAIFAIKEALDLDWTSTIITVVIGWLVQLVIGLIAGLVLGILGISASGIMGIFAR
ncbi:MAG TPA: YIP1 family protein [Anaerolineales bacterium]|nr:YIP1 family protein [Anaerolineales bacterium]